MKEILYGTNDKEPHTETVAQLAQELYNSGLLISLVENLQVIDFEVSLCMFCHERTPTEFHISLIPINHLFVVHLFPPEKKISCTFSSPAQFKLDRILIGGVDDRLTEAPIRTSHLLTLLYSHTESKLTSFMLSHPETASD